MSKQCLRSPFKEPPPAQRAQPLCQTVASRANFSSKPSSLDSFGIAASFICLVHCLALPLLISAIPAFGMQILESDWTHKVLAFFVLAFAVSAIVPNYLKYKKIEILLGMFVGLALVLFATFACGHLIGEEFEIPLITIGNLIIVSTHLANRILCKCAH